MGRLEGKTAKTDSLRFTTAFIRKDCFVAIKILPVYADKLNFDGSSQ